MDIRPETYAPHMQAHSEILRAVESGDEVHIQLNIGLSGDRSEVLQRLLMVTHSVCESMLQMIMAYSAEQGMRKSRADTAVWLTDAICRLMLKSDGPHAQNLRLVRREKNPENLP